MRNGRAMRTSLVVFAALALLSAAAVAQTVAEYKIGQGDALSISVWRHPELERTVVVRSNGRVTFPPIGDVTAEGLMPSDLSREIMQRLRDYTRETTQVTVTVAQFNSRAVFLTGQVVGPGRYSFEAIPDLLQLLSSAGGPLPSADLSQVSIIRATPTGPSVITIDVGSYMRGQATQPLPTLEPGDTIEIPSILGTSAAGAQGMVFIFGEVGSPGAYPAGSGTDLLQLIAVAGGTTPGANLNEVSVVMDGGNGQVVARVDLKDVIENGTATPFMLAAGDRVIVPATDATLAGQILGGIGSVFGYTSDLMSSYLLYLTLDREVDAKSTRDVAATQ
ncbi:MAG: polysaccharide biosynthesis/export family protein [Candidatus Eisenbacteria bacterium]